MIMKRKKENKIDTIKQDLQDRYGVLLWWNPICECWCVSGLEEE